MSKIYHINYHTHNTYEARVTEAMFELMVSPCHNETQVIRNVSCRNSLDQEVFIQRNAFGFHTTCIRSVVPFTDFEFWMSATVEKLPQETIPASTLSVEEEKEMLESVDFLIDHHLYLEITKFTSISDNNKNKVLYRRPDQPVYDYLKQLNQHIHGMLEFDQETTHVHTTANEVLDISRGVCQDYTHLYLAMARLNRIPCRYVSGYLNQGGNLTGSAVMHAWVETYVPGFGWCGFDPTNNLLVDMDHIKTAHGADYSDCSPIKGVLRTKGTHYTSYGVNVVSKMMQDAGAAQ